MSDIFRAEFRREVSLIGVPAGLLVLMRGGGRTLSVRTFCWNLVPFVAREWGGIASLAWTV
jgi:hypothetical protein